MKERKINLIFFSYRPYLNATSRYRVYKIAQKLNKNEFKSRILIPFPNYFYNKLINSKNPLTFFVIQIINLLVRIFQLFIIRRNQIIIIQKELIRIGPPILEKIVSKINPNIIFDIDDADFHMRGILYDHNKFKKIIKMSKIIFTGNSYLKNFAKKYCKNVITIPTLIDTDNYVIKKLKKKKSEQEYVIGWVGTPKSLKNLKLIEKPLQILAQKHPIILHIISSGSVELENIPTKVIPWSLKDERFNLRSIDIGIMPLYDNPYNRGKCGFKLLQYMALGIPSVSSPVGVNSQIINHGENGFLASSTTDWVKSIQLLIENRNLYEKIHKKSRQKVIESYSLRKYIPVFENIFERFYSRISRK